MRLAEVSVAKIANTTKIFMQSGMPSMMMGSSNYVLGKSE